MLHSREGGRPGSRVFSPGPLAGQQFQYRPLTNIAVLAGGALGTDVVSSASGNLFVPQTPEQFSYDLDGNLLTDGRWTYTWDAENRLVQMADSTGLGPQVVISFAYDWKGRRISKTVKRWDSASQTFVSPVATLFVYDLPAGAPAQAGGWNLIARLNATNNALAQSYLWGVDLSGTEQGAGGVGGLLVVNDAVNGAHFVAYDGNGNVVGLVKAADGTTSALYEYGPFGELIRATGPMAKANPLRFSTKYQDDETDLVYYGYRYYNASTGRWISRDPVVEVGFRALNFSPQPLTTEMEAPHPPDLLPMEVLLRPDQRSPYVFVSNDAVDVIDALGLWQLWCRPLETVGTFWHCYIECGGHSYSLLKDDGTAVKKIDDRRDKGKGQLIASGAGKCGCIAAQFAANSGSYPYTKLQCNSNYYAHNLLKCCGVDLGQPSWKAKGWDSCNDISRSVGCICWSGDR